jgi:cytochrome c oxidase subunit 4
MEVPGKGQNSMDKHITSEKTYYLIFAALIGLTMLTVALSFIHLPEAGHFVVGMAIALSKAILVVLFFMHLLHSSRLSWMFLLAGLFWVGILMSLTLADYLTRDILDY